MVGRVTTAVGPVYVKRYNVHAWRVALGSLGRAVAGAARVRRRAARWRALGFGVPEVVAAVEERRARPAPPELLRDPRGDGRGHRRPLLGAARRGRPRASAGASRRALGDLFRRLHAAGVYHNDLKDVNVLVRAAARTAPEFVLLDLERVRIGTAREPAAPHRRTWCSSSARSGRAATRDRRGCACCAPTSARGASARACGAWVGRGRAPRPRARTAGRPRRRARPRAGVACAVVCQDEAAQIGPCLDSVAWCDEVVVVDGGSRDATVGDRAAARAARDPQPLAGLPGAEAVRARRARRSHGCSASTRTSASRPSWRRRSAPRWRACRDDVDGFAIPRLVPYLGRWWYRGGWWPRPGRPSRAPRTRRVGRRRSARSSRGARRRVVRLHAPDPALHVRRRRRPRAQRRDADGGGGGARCRRAAASGSARLLGEPAVALRALPASCSGGFREGHRRALRGGTDAFYVFLRWARVWDRERRV